MIEGTIMSAIKLEAYLNNCSTELGEQGDAIAKIINTLGEASVSIRNIINQGALGAAFNGVKGGSNSDGDLQKDLDVYADDVFIL